jgi:hypothetical protein
MKDFSRWALPLMVLAGTALLFMGTNNQVMAAVASGATTSVISKDTGSTMAGIASKVTSSATTSVVSKMTGSTVTGVASRLTGSATISVISKPTVTPVALSPYDEDLARTIKFDRQVLLIVKEETRERIQRLVGYDENNYQIMTAGIAVSVLEDKTDHILSSLRLKLLPLQYQAFVVEINSGLKIDRIGVLKGIDQYEVLRIMHTDGDEYDITNQDVIDRLKEWEEIASFDIIGADSDWLEIEFKRLPRDLHAFVEEVYEFCPDAIDQGPGALRD